MLIRLFSFSIIICQLTFSKLDPLVKPFNPKLSQWVFLHLLFTQLPIELIAFSQPNKSFFK